MIVVNKIFCQWLRWRPGKYNHEILRWVTNQWGNKEKFQMRGKSLGRR